MDGEGGMDFTDGRTEKTRNGRRRRSPERAKGRHGRREEAKAKCKDVGSETPG